MPRSGNVSASERRRQSSRAPNVAERGVNARLRLSLALSRADDAQVAGALALMALVAPPASGGSGYARALVCLRMPAGERLQVWAGLEAAAARRSSIVSLAGACDTRSSVDRGSEGCAVGVQPAPLIDALRRLDLTLPEGPWQGLCGRWLELAREAPASRFLGDALASPVPVVFGGQDHELPGGASPVLERILSGRTIVAAALPGSYAPLGLLIAEPARGRSPEGPQLELLSWWAQQAAGVLGRHLGPPERHEAAGRLELHEELAARAVAATNLPDLLEQAGRIVADGLDAAWVTFWRTCGQTADLDHPVEFRRVTPPAVSQLCGILEDAAREAVQETASLRIPDLAQRPGPYARTTGDPMPALIEPLVAQDEVVGVAAVTLPRGRADFSPGDAAFLRSVASQVALAAKLARQTDLLRLSEERLRELELERRRGDQLVALGQMSAQLAHEIRNPLAAVGGLARRIARRLGQDDPDLEPAQLIVHEVGRLEKMLADFLDASRPTRARLFTGDLNAIVRDAVDLVRSNLLEAGIILEESYAAELPNVLLDADKIKQVLLNVLNNAKENMEEGDTIHLETFRREGQIVCEIANTGERLPGELLERLFASFVSGRPGGTGMGLAISQQIIKEHGGEITVRSDDTWSAVFTLSLPIARNRDRRARERRSGQDRRRAA